MSDPNDKTPDQDVEDLISAVDETDPIVAEEAKIAEATGVHSEAEVVNQVTNVVPMHAVGGAIVKRGRGRPKKVQVQPTADDLAYHAEMTRRKATFIDADSIVSGTRDRKDAIEVLQRIKEQIALEAAALHFQRLENEKIGKDSAQVSSRRIAALREVAAIELEIRKLGVHMVDLRSEQIQRVFKLFISKIKDTARDVLPVEQFDLLFNRLGTALDGWEDEAEGLIR
jgi:hypothetical protein